MRDWDPGDFLVLLIGIIVIIAVFAPMVKEAIR